MAADRSVRLLCALDEASTSRVLNLRHIARANAGDPEHGQTPLFLSPAINTAFLLRHRIRPDEDYLFKAPRSTGIKVIVPFDLSDLRAGGRSFFVGERGFIENLRAAGHYSDDEKLERDVKILNLLDAIPSLDPFLLREHLRNNEIQVAPCYFAISTSDQERMHEFVSAGLSRLVTMASGDGGDNGSTGRMVTAMLSGQINEKLEPLRMTLGMNEADFREGTFSWRGFLYYKWAIQNFAPGVMGILRQIMDIRPHGAVSDAQHAYLTSARRNIIELVRDNDRHICEVLNIYDTSFAGLTGNSSPKAFRDFLLSAPCMFLDLGEKIGAISHIVSFWRYRFPPDKPALVDAEELSALFQDFTSGFAERGKAGVAAPARPAMAGV